MFLEYKWTAIEEETNCTNHDIWYGDIVGRFWTIESGIHLATNKRSNKHSEGIHEAICIIDLVVNGSVEVGILSFNRFQLHLHAF